VFFGVVHGARLRHQEHEIDGVGQPNDWFIVTGAVDSLGYETIEYETKRIEADYSTPFIESGSASRTCGRRSGAG